MFSNQRVSCQNNKNSINDTIKNFFFKKKKKEARNGKNHNLK